eukprot:1932650-Prymnesium_polylepis.1
MGSRSWVGGGVGGQAGRWYAWGRAYRRWSGGVNSRSMRFTPTRRTSNPAFLPCMGRKRTTATAPVRPVRPRPHPEAGLHLQGRQEQGKRHQSGCHR